MEVFLYAFKKQVWEISSNWLIFQSLLFSIEVVVNFLCSLQTSYPANLLLIYLLIRGDALGINSLNFCLPVLTQVSRTTLCAFALMESGPLPQSHSVPLLHTLEPKSVSLLSLSSTIVTFSFFFSFFSSAHSYFFFLSFFIEIECICLKFSILKWEFSSNIFTKLQDCCYDLIPEYFHYQNKTRHTHL